MHGLVRWCLSRYKKQVHVSLPSAATTWETGKADVSEIPTDIIVDSSKLPLTKNEDGEQVLRMYWLDAYEDAYKQPGKAHTFSHINWWFWRHSLCLVC